MKVHDSQAYRKMDVTREHISHILELREILLSFQSGFTLVTAAVVCAILESISGLEPSSVITEPRYLGWLSVLKHYLALSPGLASVNGPIALTSSLCSYFPQQYMIISSSK